MNIRSRTFAAVALLLSRPMSALAGDGLTPSTGEAPRRSPAVLLAQAEQQDQPGAPESPRAPAQPPPSTQPGSPPPSPAPSPPFADEPRTGQRPQVPPGQWVYTQQYGWVWMPYADQYTYVPPDGYGEPYAYVYYPAVGWTWIVAPWVWGLGPWPYFGVGGPLSFAWYHHGWWRSPWRWHFAPGFAFHGVRPVPPRGALVWHGAPGRAFVVPRGGHAVGVFRGGGRHR